MLGFSNAKAGLSGVDKKRVQQVIDQTGGAKFNEFSKKKRERIEKQCNAIRDVLDRATPAEWMQAEKEMRSACEKLERHRDLSRHCVHIDMDSYFASVEMRDDPSLRTVPMAVGGNSMLSTANYEARKFGIRSGMPGFIALKLCPTLKIVPCNFRSYRKNSEVFSAIFAEYDPEMTMGSLDEVYMDITEYVEERTESKKFPRIRYGGDCVCRLPLENAEDVGSDVKQNTVDCPKCGKQRIVFEDEVEFGTGRGEVVKEIRFRVEQATGLTCSAGIAANFKLAKICSDMNKPNGQFELANDREIILEFLQNLSIRKVSGIGAVGEAHLKAIGIETVGDLRNKLPAIRLVFASLAQESYLRTSLGMSGRHRDSDPARKSISVERTFTPTADVEQIKEIHNNICEILVRDMERSEIVGGKTITLKLKLATFDVLTRSYTAEKLISALEDIKQLSFDLLSKKLDLEIRLLGVRLSNLTFVGEAENETTKGEKRKTILDMMNEANEKKKRIGLEDDGDVEIVEQIDGQAEESRTGNETEEEIETGPSTTTNEEIENTESGTVICPICEMQLPDNNRIMNRHIDACLNREFIKNETRQNQAETSKKEDRQPQTKDKKMISQSAEKSRRKTNDKATAVKKRSKTIAEYFNKAHPQ
ncbi:hypothetical protein WR25_15991 [Diploscapter pachys]|uniref:DNA polymerase kappa n=1 Tax=Diploscapter pachys TaxID=2018661 RepID=A0A2A2M104_9BILA|nr:hypothetical protein WR25_15991 [Diploscapter pachys]